MISLYDLIEASNGQLFGEAAAHLFDDFCLDVETAGENQLFIAVKSEMGDTHQFIPEAIAKGVSGVICQTPPDCDTDGVSVILVKDTVSALLAWAHYILGRLGTKVIAVTGSAGKSIAVDAISKVLSKHHDVHVGLSIDRGRLSAPLSLAHLKPNHKFIILKLGTNYPGEMASIVEAIEPEVGVITHVGDLYDDRFETPEQVVKEKSILIDYLSPSGLAVLNYDDDYARSMARRTRAQVKTVGMLTSFGPDMIAYNVAIGPEGTGFDLRCGDERHSGQWIPLFGQYHLYSVMSALTIGQHYGIPLADSLQTLTELKPLPGRMNSLVGINDSALVDDTYSANPASTMAALDWLESFKEQPGRIFFVFADMENLGKNSQISHRRVGQRAAKVADVLVTQGTQTSLTARAALDHGMHAEHVHTTYATSDTIATLTESYQLQSNDIVLLKGGPSARLEQVTRALLKNPAESNKLVRQDAVWDRLPTSQPTHFTWVEIDTDSLANNTRILKALIGEKVTLMAVVKANAYGHGAVVAAQTALLNGADYLGVSSLREAVELRDAGIDAPILMMNYTPPYMARHAIQQHITMTVYDLNIARAYDRVAREVGNKVKVHVKVDSGMGRLGTMPDEAVALFRHLVNMQNLEIEGIYTHYSTADEDFGYLQEQLANFKAILKDVRTVTGIRFKYIHTANSAATIAASGTHFNMVRPGLALYGMHPSEQVKLPEGSQPVMTWKTIIAQVKTLPPGHPVGYGNTYITKGEETIAILPVGYADGLRRAPENWGDVLVHGQRAPIIGRVSMEKTMINVSHISDVTIGDEVVLLGRQRDEIITAEEIANNIGTINYEITCGILPRISRR